MIRFVAPELVKQRGLSVCDRKCTISCSLECEDEDVNCDTERRHTNEEVSVVAFSGQCII